MKSRRSDSLEAGGTSRKRILTIDGGGIRGVFAIEILVRMEELLREHHRNPELVLADHFDFIAGTSTGAIIATFLSWGDSAVHIREMYAEIGPRMFARPSLLKRRKALYSAQALSEFLRGYFSEDDQGEVPALLGTEKLRTLLMVVMRNADSGSAWPVTNNPRAKFNQRDLPDCNLDIPLWQLVRASSALPVFFPPEKVVLGGTEFTFVDGGVTAYANPSVIAFLTATLPCYRVGWPCGTDRLRVVSVGTGRAKSSTGPGRRDRLGILQDAVNLPIELTESINTEQDLICRVLGQCEFGDPIDMELGDLAGPGVLADGEKKFAYVRYNQVFNRQEVAAAESEFAGRFRPDNFAMIPWLQRAGAAYAQHHVRLEHLL
ncbi:patatin-like phospholipase family protein [Haloferula sp. A504]|uniref:patatin-like phospholipase family protein n=1 Tax=Haloferula sp. A504 TaxID=3373601 RepID=UPI0031BD3F90|nr:patatin-like phospholipase family protein [Verrucomicrobiaceae bacterium E54]